MKKIKSTKVGLCLSVGLLTCSTAIAQTKNSHQSWFNLQIQKNPSVVQAYEQVKTSEFIAASAAQAIYNPSLEGEVEKEGDENNFSIGLSQTIDLWDKQAINKRIGELAVFIGQQNAENHVQSVKADALSALIEWQMAAKASLLAQEQESLLQKLLAIAEDKNSVGLIGQLDAELIYLNLSQALSEIAQMKIALKTAELKVKEYLPEWTTKREVIPAQGLGVSEYRYDENWIKQHPAVVLAQGQFEIKKLQAKLAEKQAKADPTFGVSAGKTGSENTLGLTFSMPLNIRNNYSQDINAAYSDANAEEAAYRAMYRKQRFQAEASFESLTMSQNYFQQWLTITKKSSENTLKLLNKRWDAGDINTSDYLLALNQRAEALYAGVKLEQQVRLNEISYLLAVGQINKLAL